MSTLRLNINEMKTIKDALTEFVLRLKNESQENKEKFRDIINDAIEDHEKLILYFNAKIKNEFEEIREKKK